MHKMMTNKVILESKLFKKNPEMHPNLEKLNLKFCFYISCLKENDRII